LELSGVIIFVSTGTSSALTIDLQQQLTIADLVLDGMLNLTSSASGTIKNVTFSSSISNGNIGGSVSVVGIAAAISSQSSPFTISSSMKTLDGIVFLSSGINNSMTTIQNGGSLSISNLSWTLSSNYTLQVESGGSLLLDSPVMMESMSSLIGFSGSQIYLNSDILTNVKNLFEVPPAYLTIGGALNIESSLEIAVIFTTIPSSNAIVSVSSGSMLSFSGPMTRISQGTTLTSTGASVVLNNGEMIVDGTLDQQQDISSTFSTAAGTLLTLSETATIVFSQLQAVLINGDLSLSCSIESSSALLVNQSTILSSSSTDVISLNLPFMTFGSLTISSGTFEFNQTLISSGPFVLNSGATLIVNGQYSMQSSILNGTGSLHFIFWYCYDRVFKDSSISRSRSRWNGKFYC